MNSAKPSGSGSRGRKMLGRILALGGAATGLVAINSVPVAAHTGQPSMDLLADNGDHTVCKSSLTSTVSQAVDHAVDMLDDTAMASWLMGCTSNTDSVNFDQDYTTFGGQTWHGSGGTTIGLNICVTQSKGICHQSEDRYDLSWIGSGQPEGNDKWLVLHEIGHSVGMDHRSGPYVMNVNNNNLTDYSDPEKHWIDHQW